MQAGGCFLSKQVLRARGSVLKHVFSRWPCRDVISWEGGGEVPDNGLLGGGPVVFRGVARLSGGAPLLIVEDGGGGAGVGGEPVEVFFGELFGGVAGSVDDAHYYCAISSVEDGDG